MSREYAIQKSLGLLQTRWVLNDAGAFPLVPRDSPKALLDRESLLSQIKRFGDIYGGGNVGSLKITVLSAANLPPKLLFDPFVEVKLGDSVVGTTEVGD